MKSNLLLFQTLSSGFCALKTNLEIVASAFNEWQASILEPLGASVIGKDVLGLPSDLISSIFPLVSPTKTKHLFLAFGAEWVICVDNGYRGTSASLATVMSGKCNCLGIRVVSQPHTFNKIAGTGIYGAEIFESYETGSESRTVFCANDGGRWKFGQSGTAYPVENVNNFDSRVVRERFTHSDLVCILQYLGVNAFDDHWAAGQCSKGKLFSRKGTFPINYREYL